MNMRRILLFVLLLLVTAVALWDPPLSMPVAGASAHDWHPDSFWYEPWGASGVHKGIDIFAGHGTPVEAPVAGLVLFSGEWRLGGNVVLLLAPGWRVHYLAHLQQRNVTSATLVGAGHPLGTVGDSGNARGKPPHLHYSIVDLIPRPWRADATTQGWKKMFFRDPSVALAGS